MFPVVWFVGVLSLGFFLGLRVPLSLVPFVAGTESRCARVVVRSDDKDLRLYGIR